MAGGGGTYHSGSLFLPKGFVVLASNTDPWVFYLCDNKLSIIIQPKLSTNGGPTFTVKAGSKTLTRVTSMDAFVKDYDNGEYIILTRSGGGSITP